MPLTVYRQAFRPLEYSWAYDAYLKQNQAHWLPTEVPMSTDVEDYRTRLTPEEVNLVTQVLRFFVTSDMEVSSNYMSRLAPKFPVPEVAMMLASFANMEGVHVQAYSYLIDTLGLPESEYQSFTQYESMRRKYDYLHGFKSESLEDLAKTLAVFGAFMEGTALFASFAILMNFPRQGKLNGVGQIITWSQRDENLHADYICRLYRQLLLENPQINSKTFQEEIVAACVNMVEMEDAFIDTCFEMGAVRGLSSQDVKEYVRWTADNRLADLGLLPVFNVAKNPLPWLAAMLSAKEHVNFFEGRATDYAKANVDDTWPE